MVSRPIDPVNNQRTFDLEPFTHQHRHRHERVGTPPGGIAGAAGSAGGTGWWDRLGAGRGTGRGDDQRGDGYAQ
jgi:hypothetical protein